MANLKLKFVHEFKDRHGRTRRYFRRPGHKRVPLPGFPGSEEFMSAYQAAISGGGEHRSYGESRSKPGTISAAIAGYFSSAAFQTLAATTQGTYRGILERFRTEFGHLSVANLQRKHVEAILSQRASTPAAANNTLRMVRILMHFAISVGLRKDDPTLNVKPVRARSEGFYTWTESDITKFEEAYPVGTRARLAMGLLLYTAQRRSDIVKMGRQHVKDGVLTIRQQKTGTTVEIPIHPELQAIIDATLNSNLTFLVTDFGKPFAAAGFGNLFRSWCNQAGLPPECSSHGLRKAASRRLAEAGCTAHEIMAITGHKTLKEVTRYTAAVDRKRLGQTAMAKIRNRTSSGKP